MRLASPLPPAPSLHVRILALTLALAGSAPSPSLGAALRNDLDPGGIERYEYVSPLPGAALVSRWNNVALREGSAVQAHSLAAARIAVTGSESGPHAGRLVLSDDARTVVFRPELPFAPGEEVEVRLEGGIRTRGGEELPGVAFHFSVAAHDPAEPWSPELEESMSEEPAASSVETGPAGDESAALTAATCAPLPASYPPITLMVSNHPDPGYVFLSPFRAAAFGHLVILDNLAQPVFYRRIPEASTDFKLQPDGRLTYLDRPPDGSSPRFFALDASYAVVDSFASGNGYRTDAHDLQILPNGHALLMSYDPQPVRMDTVVSGGRRNAIVVGLIVQEIDRDKNVVFQWRSWDHFQITDAASPFVLLTGSNIDYVHGNSVERDLDGNILISSRHLNEVTKISRATGQVLWRMGLHARNNQFTFVNDSRGFSHLHDVRRLPNGHITVFDNGNFVSPQYSRALEYEVDEAARRATLVWEYRNTPDTYGSFMGNVQRRPDGGTMVCWGGSTFNPRLTELHADGTKAFELGLAGGTWTYRAFRFPWRTDRFVTDATSLDFGEVRIGESAGSTITVTNPGASEVTIDCAFATDAAFAVSAPVPTTLGPGRSIAVEVRFTPTAPARVAAKLYVRSTGEGELIAQDVDLAGTGFVNRPPDCRAARATPAELWPPDHGLVPIAVEGVSDPDGDPVAIEVTSVTQDEALIAEDGAACPDALLSNGAAWLRAERSGAGDGRIYRIAFLARDPAGASCEGEVSVCVPHDLAEAAHSGAAGVPHRAALEDCIESGDAVSSLGPCPEPAAPSRAAMSEGIALAALPDRAGAAIEFALPAEAEVSLGVYDLAGRRVAALASGRLAAGSHRVTWSATGVPAGIYYCRVRAAGLSVTKPILVVR